MNVSFSIVKLQVQELQTFSLILLLLSCHLLLLPLQSLQRSCWMPSCWQV